MSVASRAREAAKSPTRRSAELDHELDALAKPIVVLPSGPSARRRRRSTVGARPGGNTGRWKVSFPSGSSKTCTDKAKAKKAASRSGGSWTPIVSE